MCHIAATAHISTPPYPSSPFILPTCPASQILQYGRVMRPALGIAIAPPQVLQRLGQEGVLVLDTPEGSPAAAAGLQPTYRDQSGEPGHGTAGTAQQAWRSRDLAHNACLYWAVGIWKPHLVH